MNRLSILLLLLPVILAVGCNSGGDRVVAPTETTEIDLQSPGVAFASAAGPCPSGVDCGGFVQLLADGTLRVNRFGEMPERLYKARVTAAELDRVLELARDPDLVAFVIAGEPCPNLPSDYYATVRLQTAWAQGSAQICDGLGVELGRALVALADKYMGGYNLAEPWALGQPVSAPNGGSAEPPPSNR